MNKISLIVLCTALSMVFKGYGAEKINQSTCTYGFQRYGKETVESIQEHGSIILEGTRVLGLARVNGNLTASESAIGSLQVNGQVDLKNCVVNDGASIKGSLIADKTKFQKELSVASQKIILSACSVDSLMIREVKGYDGLQVIDLRSGTKINGPIVVESGHGEIWLSSGSEISDQVSGAIVVKK